MTEFIGTMEVPSVAPATGETAGFPELGYLADFCQAVLNVDALAQWQAVGNTTLPVLTKFTHNPKKSLDDSKLPSIYCFFSEEHGKWVSDGLRTVEAKVEIQWIMEPCQPEMETLRDPTQSLVSRILFDALSNGRNPAWTVAGDTDPYAVTWGSSLAHYVGALNRLDVGAFKQLFVEIQILDGQGKVQPLYGVAGSVSFDMVLRTTTARGPIEAAKLIATTAQTPYTVAGKNNIPEWFPGPVIPVVR